MSIIGKQVSKEAINSRLLKNAVHFWGVKNVNSLDPFVRLLMDALSSELFNAYNDIQNTESRILERITRLLTPDIYVSPRPAHAIAFVRPNEAGQILHAHSQLGFQKKVQRKENGMVNSEYAVAFTPVDTVPLWNGEVRYYASGSVLYSFDHQRNRAVQGVADSSLPLQSAWLGLTMDREESLKDVSFYASFNPEIEDWLYVLLSAARWETAGGQPMRVKPGLAYTVPQADEITEESIFSDYEIVKMLENEVKSIYGKHFVTIEDLDRVWESSDPYAVPAELSEQFNVGGLPKGEPVVWVKIVFPSFFSREVLNSLSFTLNAFPILNRKPKHHFHPVQDLNNVIPLVPEAYEYFLAVVSLTDDRKRSYVNVPQGTSDLSQGHFSVRYGGVERFDKRNAQEYMSYLTELLRDEVASFAAYGKEFVTSMMTELIQRIKLVEQKAGRDPNKHYEVPTYLFLEPIDNASVNMEVHYWLTNCTLANGIRSGSKLMRVTSSVANSGDPMLLTTTRGGRTKLQAFDRVNAYKYALTTRNRLVTREDLKSFCSYYLGKQVKHVEIRKGLQPGRLSKEGLVTTFDIVLYPTEEATGAHWDVICSDLLSQITTRCMDGVRYRVRLLA